MYFQIAKVTQLNTTMLEGISFEGKEADFEIP